MEAIWNVLWFGVSRMLKARPCVACRRGLLPGHSHLVLDDQPIPYRVVPRA